MRWPAVLRPTFLIGCLTTVLNCVSQLAVHAVGGVGASWIRNISQISVSRGEKLKIMPGTSWLVGAEMRFTATPRFTVGSGLLLSSINGSDEHFVGGELYARTERSMYYLSLPMIAGFRSDLLELGAGIQVSCLLMSHGTFTGQGADAMETIPLDPLPLVKTDMGLVGVATCGIGDRWQLGLRCYHGLQNINDHATGFAWTLQNRQALVMLAYRPFPRLRNPVVDPEQPIDPLPDQS